MPYTINNFNGTVFTTLADGVIDKQFSSSIYLLGKNVTGYGSYQNDNFLWLMQNFAGSNAPINPVQGQTWFDNSTNALRLKLFDGTNWTPLTSITPSATAPASAVSSLWHNTASNQLFLGTDSGTNWTLVGPEAVSGFGKTKFEAGALTDTSTQAHAAIRLFDDGQLLGVITTSSFNVAHTEDVFTASILTTIGGLSFVPGIGLQTNYITAGLSTNSGTLTGSWTVDSIATPLASITTLTGITISASTITTSALSSPTISSTNISAAGVTTDNMTATTVITTQITAGAYNTNAQIIGNWLLGYQSQLSSTYADLAENYTADDTYSPGVVMEFGGDAETTVCKTDMSTRVAGIISTNPAFLLNDQYEIEGYVYSLALAGRVPCYVKGTINKGDMLVSGNGGYARAESNPKPGTVIARAIDSYDSDEIGMIEVQVCRG
jgi:hypothetical protein